MKIPFNRPFTIGSELQNIAQAVSEGHISGDGPFTARCHSWLEQRLHCHQALLTHSGTAALEMAAMLCDIQPGDEVIMPSFTFVSTANAFVLRGGVPVFVDIRADTLNIDEKLIERAITPRTKAIVPVHYGGEPCDMGMITTIAERHRLRVIEDAAHALLSTHRGKYLGTIGHLGCLSFHETKTVICGEGGALLINDEQLIRRAQIIREKGTNRNEFLLGYVDKYTWVDIGSSFLPSELVAAFLYGQLEKADDILDRRRQLWRRYADGLQDLAEQGRLRFPHPAQPGLIAAQMFYIVLESDKARTALLDHLRLQNIHAVFHYIPLHLSPAGRKFARISGQLCITETTAERLLRLPLYYEMQESQVDRVLEAIKDFFRRTALI